MGNRFSRKFKLKLSKLKVETDLMKNYVDDFLVALKGLDPGVRYDVTSMKMIRVEELVESDKGAQDDTRTMNELQKIKKHLSLLLQQVCRN